MKYIWGNDASGAGLGWLPPCQLLTAGLNGISWLLKSGRGTSGGTRWLTVTMTACANSSVEDGVLVRACNCFICSIWLINACVSVQVGISGRSH
jgi:hypothetical protein